jgi:hypothetical protein
VSGSLEDGASLLMQLLNLINEAQSTRNSLAPSIKLIKPNLSTEAYFLVHTSKPALRQLSFIRHCLGRRRK